MSITLSKQTSVYRQVDAILKRKIYTAETSIQIIQIIQIYPPRSTVYDLPAIFNQQTVNQQQSSVREYKSVTNSTLFFYVHHK